MKIIITGAQFANKGAQSMLFNVIDQLRKEYDDVNIYFLTLDGNKIENEKDFRFNTIYGISFYQKYYESLFNRLYLIIFHSLRKILKKRFYLLRGTKQIKSVFKNADLLIDISGYCLSSKWPISTNKMFLNYFSEAEKYNISSIIMPQSFGPFDYAENQKEMDSIIHNTLKNVKIIFAREQEGYDFLTKRYHLSNVYQSPDLVLQNKELQLSNVFISKPNLKNMELETSRDNVCIIPNTQTAVHGARNKIKALYLNIIDSLKEKGKNIYIFNHADDVALCMEIYDSVKDIKGVYLIKEELNSLEYESFIKQFDYIICSRYHGIVHAYRQYTPAIILGWAIKYKELARLFSQSEFIFDITQEEIPEIKILEAVEKMNSRYSDESEIIKKTLNEIQADTCFDKCWKLMKK